MRENAVCRLSEKEVMSMRFMLTDNGINLNAGCPL
jgi:hypothetical protein